MVIGNPQQRSATIASFILHIAAVLTVLLFAPGAAVPIVRPPRYRVTPLTFTPPQRVHRLLRVQSGATPDHPVLPDRTAPAVHTAGFDQSHISQSTNDSGTGGVLVGKWDFVHGASTPSLPVGTPGLAGLYAPGANGTQPSGSRAEPIIDAPARLLATPKPGYSDEARGLRVTGEVVLEVLLSATGTVHVLRVVSGLGHGLDEAAITAVNQTRCRPALRNGQPCDITATIRVIFQLT